MIMLAIATGGMSQVLHRHRDAEWVHRIRHNRQKLRVSILHVADANSTTRAPPASADVARG
jgi:hypothetical protein